MGWSCLYDEKHDALLVTWHGLSDNGPFPGPTRTTSFPDFRRDWKNAGRATLIGNLMIMFQVTYDEASDVVDLAIDAALELKTPKGKTHISNEALDEGVRVLRRPMSDLEVGSRVSFKLVEDIVNAVLERAAEFDYGPRKAK
jgi:hypothetical protein